MDNIKIKTFTDLIAWREAHKLVLMTYQLVKKFPSDERFGLISQMCRAAVSITSNIAEGFGRHGYGEKIQFYYLAQGSLTELKNQFIIGRDVEYFDAANYQIIETQSNIAHRLLQGLITKTKEFWKSGRPLSLNHKS